MLLRTKGKAGPLVRKSAMFPFQIAVVCWLDLLGYGAMIAEADFNPMHSKAVDAMKRLRSFHRTIADHSARTFPTLVMNDGAAAYRDLSMRSRAPTHDFLMRAWRLFQSIQKEEEANGFPGARVVLATGFRMRGRRAGMDATAAQFQSVMRRFQAKEISADQAIREAAHIRRPFDIIPALQANFAFTKAYIAESSGSKGGLVGANFFVDLALFEAPTPPWVVKAETVPWSNEQLRMKASFARILDLPRYRHLRGGPLGIRDGLEVAQHITGDRNVLDALRAAQKPS
jgi:hypothetical protein